VSNDLQPEGYSTEVLRGIAAFEAGAVAAAEEAFRTAAAQGDATGALWLGWVLSDAGRLAEAADAYEQAAASGHPEATLNLALLFAGPRPEEARRLFELAAGRGDLRGMFELGFFLWAHGNHEEAAEAFRKAANSGDPRGFLHLGFLLAKVGEEDDALAAFEEAATRGVEEGWTQAGWQLAQLGRDDEAEAMLRRAWDLGDRVSGGVLRDVLEALGRPKEAEAISQETEEWAEREVDLSYRPLLHTLLGEEDEEDDGLRAWVSEEWESGTPLQLPALHFDAAWLAEAETGLLLQVEGDNEAAARKLAELYEKTGRAAKAKRLRD
jgi:tetratricopeptide (TPR) repeat protein